MGHRTEHGRPLYVYLIDHGGIDKFMIYPGEILTADQLNGYLDIFQAETGRQVIVFIEACKSGSFKDNLITYGQNRIVVTSTDMQDSYMQLDGWISFTQFIVDRLQAGDSVRQALDLSVVRLLDMGLPYSLMQPQLVEGVALSANDVMVGGDFAIAGLFPEITETSSNKNISANTSQNFYAKLSCLDEIESVWAVVVPPNYVPPVVGDDLTTPEVALPMITLTDPESDGQFDGSYRVFPYNGNYQITFYARNINGNVSVSPAITVIVTGVVEIDTDHDGVADAFDNCPNKYNPQQLDADHDNIGDVCDSTPGCGGCGQAACEQYADSDHDGIPDVIDNCPNI